MTETAQSTTKSKLSWRAAAGYFVLRTFPNIRKAYWRTVFRTIDRSADDQDFVFMNLGYAFEHDADLAPPIPADHFQRQLYERVVCSVALTDKTVLEVGCGRGGGAAALHAKFSPKAFVGVDLTLADAERCRALHPRPGLEFRQGDAMNLPFPADNFDVVVNVESSHCYPSRGKFFSEVKRVLRPGGHFCYADLIWQNLDGVDVAALENLLKASGLCVVDHEDMSDNVLRSRTLAASDRSFETSSLERWASAKVKSAALRNETLAYPGSSVYQSLADGSASYRRWVLRK